MRCGYAVLLGLTLIACGEEGTRRPQSNPRPDAGVVPLPDVGGPSELPDCTPALTLGPLNPAVEPFGRTTFVAQGGTGAYRFVLLTPEQGGLLSALTGAYLAGGEAGPIDRVEVMDEGCVGRAEASVETVPALQLVPNSVSTRPGTAWTFEVAGGAGPFTFEMAKSESGGAVSPAGAYQAGEAPGLDVIVVLDEGTGRRAEAEIRLDRQARFAAVFDTVVLPVDGSAPLRFEGGSSFFDFESAPDFVEIEAGDRLQGLQSGSGLVQVRDRFTGDSAEITVVVVDPLSHEPRPSGDGLLAAGVFAPGDLDGDGWDDLLVGVPEHDGAYYNQGAVHFFRGTPNGVESTPAQSWLGSGRSDEFGRAFDVADVTGDGQPDLLVGAPNQDGAGGTDAGGVSIYAGLPGQAFEAEPITRLAGRFSFDRFGFSLSTCDFDGDGDIDLAVGARDAEDRSRSGIAFTQGEVAIFENRGGAFDVTPQRSLYGDVPDGAGDWIGVSGMRLGEALGTGDFDGDGVCDLAIGTWRHGRPGSFNDGMLSVHLGALGDGIALRPSRIWRPEDAEDRDSRFGTALAVGDVNKDRLDDILVAQPRFDSGNGDNHGAVRLFLGRPGRETASSFENANEADWSIVGADSGDQFGWRVAIGDRTGDGEPDVLVASLFVEEPGTPGNSGSVRVYRGRGIGLVPETEPQELLAGEEANLNLGGSVALLADRDADQKDEVVVFAAGDDEAGLDVGAPMLFLSREGSEPQKPELPAQAAGGRFGFGGAVVGDVNGDGFPDVVVGAPMGPVDQLGRQAGAAALYLGTADGIETQPALQLESFAGHRGFDQLGWDAAPAGDFDGDGRQDFAVVARFGDVPDDLSGQGAYQVSGAPCEGSRFNRGAVFVWRGVDVGLPDADPAFILFGPQTQGIRSLAGGGDVDGDGYDDLAIGSSDWDAPDGGNAGGYAVIRGRNASNRIVVVCESDVVVLGRRGNDGLGFGLSMGRLDGDLCADVAAGAPFDDRVVGNEGTVEVLHGWGGFGCPASPSRSIIRSGSANAQFGRAVSAGPLGGGLSDRLAVGAPFANIDGETRGQVQVFTLPPDGPRVPPEQRDTLAATQLAGTLSPLVVSGETPGGEFGHAVAVVDTRLVVGVPLGQASEVAFSGEVRLFRLQEGALVPSGLFVGEADAPTGRVGGTVHATGDTLFIGGEFGASAGPDTGSGYGIRLP
ncbi:MAG: FG-GAP-like repeat-containing protein [Myxococcota bacterium]